MQGIKMLIYGKQNYVKQLMFLHDGIHDATRGDEIRDGVRDEKTHGVKIHGELQHLELKHVFKHLLHDGFRYYDLHYHLVLFQLER